MPEWLILELSAGDALAGLAYGHRARDPAGPSIWHVIDEKLRWEAARFERGGHVGRIIADVDAQPLATVAKHARRQFYLNSLGQR
jgi:hypothetical protein